MLAFTGARLELNEVVLMGSALVEQWSCSGREVSSKAGGLVWKRWCRGTAGEELLVERFPGEVTSGGLKTKRYTSNIEA